MFNISVTACSPILMPELREVLHPLEELAVVPEAKS